MPIVSGGYPKSPDATVEMRTNHECGIEGHRHRLKLAAAICTIVHFLYFRWKVSRACIDPNGRCPACGGRNGSIKWIAEVALANGDRGAVIHACKICSANWAESPIVRAADWATGFENLQEQADSAA